jgi:hypothetical protein
MPGLVPPPDALSRLLLHHRADKLVIEVPNNEVGRDLIQHMRTTQEEIAKLRAEIAAIGGVEYDFEPITGDELLAGKRPKPSREYYTGRKRNMATETANDDKPKKKKGAA